MKIHPLTDIAHRQHGTISLVQASRHGIGRPEWRSLCRDGVIVEVFPDVGRLAGSPATDLSTIKAATLALGPEAIASHGSAALTWGASTTGASPVHLTVASRNRSTRMRGVALHRHGTSLVLETDGWTSHGLDRDQFEFDREKDAALRDAGYIVQRFTWRQVRSRGPWVAQRIRGTLQRWAPHVLAA